MSRRLGHTFVNWHGHRTPWSVLGQKHPWLEPEVNSMIDVSYLPRYLLFSDITGLVNLTKPLRGPDKSTYGYITDYKGRVIDDVIVEEQASGMMTLDINVGSKKAVEYRMQQLGVHYREVTDNKVLSVHGPNASQILREHGFITPDNRFVTHHRDPSSSVRSTSYAKGGFEVRFDIEKTYERGEFINFLQHVNLSPRGLLNREYMRVMSKLPLMGTDINGKLRIKDLSNLKWEDVVLKKPLRVPMVTDDGIITTCTKIGKNDYRLCVNKLTK